MHATCACRTSCVAIRVDVIEGVWLACPSVRRQPHPFSHEEIMKHPTRTMLGRIAIATLAAAGLAACSDVTNPTPSRSLGAAASLDRGPGDQNNKNNQGNQNQQRTRVIVMLTPPVADTAFRGAHGKAQLDARPGETQLEIEVEHIPAGTVVNFFVGGTMVGTATAGALGEAELELNTKRGDVIPATPVGTVVSAQTADGHVIVSGTF
jgi:hypothetical protein